MLSKHIYITFENTIEQTFCVCAFRTCIKKVKRYQEYQNVSKVRRLDPSMMQDKERSTSFSKCNVAGTLKRASGKKPPENEIGRKQRQPSEIKGDQHLRRKRTRRRRMKGTVKSIVR